MTAAPGRILPDLSQQLVPPKPYRGARGGKTPPRRSAGIDDAELRRLVADEVDDQEIGDRLGYTARSVREHRWAIGLHRSTGIKREGYRASHASGRQARHVEKPLAGKTAKMPAYDHAALTEARTMYPATVTHATTAPRILVEGANSWKIGGVVRKGAWKGFPIFTLTLEERATCPASCALYRSCYGNSMHMARRLMHGPEFEARLVREVDVLADQHRAGFAIRLHVLGDFYSVGYVALWRGLIERHANLRVFGFTARIDPADPITHALHDLVVDHWPRAGLRFSNAPTPILSTVTIEHPLQKPADAIICPAQLGQTSACATCALCWSTERRIAFLRH